MCVCVPFPGLLPDSWPLLVPCCCLLLRVKGMPPHISFRMACVTINSADSSPRAYNSHPPLDTATVPCHLHWLVKKNWSTHHNVQEVFFLVIGNPAQSASEFPVMCFSIPCTSRWYSMQGTSGRDSCVVFPSSISKPSWRVSNLQVLATRVCKTQNVFTNRRSSFTRRNEL